MCMCVLKSFTQFRVARCTGPGLKGAHHTRLLIVINHSNCLRPHPHPPTLDSSCDCPPRFHSPCPPQSHSCWNWKPNHHHRRRTSMSSRYRRPLRSTFQFHLPCRRNTHSCFFPNAPSTSARVDRSACQTCQCFHLFHLVFQSGGRPWNFLNWKWTVAAPTSKTSWGKGW